MGKEAYDDYKRYQRDREANSQKYLIIEPQSHASSPLLDTHANTRSIPSSSIRVGDLVRLEKNQRVPADMVLLHTSDASGTCFIRTDQLDGETDWKLRVAVSECQKLDEGDLVRLDAEVYADAPIKDIHSFIGTFTLNTPHAVALEQSGLPLHPLPPSVSPLTAENVLWSNTVLAAGSAVGFVIYTGPETRAVMNTSHPETKVGLLDLEINKLAKVCFYRSCVSNSTKRRQDSLRCDFRPVSCPCSIKWLPRFMVHLCCPVLDPILLYHPYQVGSFPSSVFTCQ